MGAASERNTSTLISFFIDAPTMTGERAVLPDTSKVLRSECRSSDE